MQATEKATKDLEQELIELKRKWEISEADLPDKISEAVMGHLPEKSDEQIVPKSENSEVNHYCSSHYFKFLFLTLSFSSV